MASELAGTEVGGWIVGDLLGNGGSALVLRARKGDQEAAVKIIDPDLEEKYGREQQEARIGFELKLVGRSHPHLIRIFDGGRCQDTNLLFLAMEYLPYKNLDDLKGSINPEKIPQIADQLAQAARFLESMDICHRDIKPENILITPDFCRIILLDLGILRPLIESEVDAGTGFNFIGTIRYSPPEFVWRNEENSFEAYRSITFYQIGAVLHDLIMGRRIFDDVQGPMALLIETVSKKIPTVVSDTVDQNLINLTRDCLHKDWRARIELVSWRSFEFKANPTSNARDRVRKMHLRKMESELNHNSNQSLGRDALRDLGVLLRNQIRDVCLRNEEIPFASYDFKLSKNEIDAWAAFDAYSQLNLTQGSRVTFRARSISADLAALKVTGSWGEPSEKAVWHNIATLRNPPQDITEIIESCIFELIANAMSNPSPILGSCIKVVGR